MSFAPKIAVIFDNHSLLAKHTSDVVEGNIGAYLLDNEPSDDVDKLSMRRCTVWRWEPLNWMTVCLVVLVTYALHADGVVVAVVVSVVELNGSHVDVGERMTTSKIRRVIYVPRWSLGSRERAENEPFKIKFAENEPITSECAENYQPITNERFLG